MLLDIPIKECNVDGHINIYIYNKRSGCLPQSTSFKVIELDFLTYLLIDAKPWSFMRESEVSMQLGVASCNPSWFACNIFICRKSTACAFICQCHWGSSSTPGLWILSCMLDESIAQAPFHCCHRHLLYLVLIALLLPLLHKISPVYSTEHIKKYRSIEIFMKLPF